MVRCVRLHSAWTMLGMAVALLLVGTASAGESPTASCVNLDPDHLPGLSAGAAQAQVKLNRAADATKPFAAGILCWEARADADISAVLAERIARHVRGGGALLLSLDAKPGLGGMRLGFMLPTTAWGTRFATSAGGGANCAVGMTRWDPDFFAHPPTGLAVPFAFGVRTVSALERGQGRYEIFARTIAGIDLAVPAGNTFWTRPLIDRDWQVRVRGDDLAGSPLLLTGRYGAGRVAVLASACAGIDAQPQAPAFWQAVFAWLSASDPAPVMPLAGAPTIEVEVDRAAHALVATVLNPTPSALRVRLVARISTWERALIGDQEREATVPAAGRTRIELPLPRPGPTAYQALEARDAFVMRLGLVAADGALALGERTVQADFRPPLALTLATDEVGTIAYPFTAAPGPETLFFPQRMGMPLASYAYKPGQTATIAVTIANGVSNLAPLAEVRDETTPDNPTILALHDEATFSEKIPIDGIQAHGSWIGKEGVENVVSFTFAERVTISALTLYASPAGSRGYPHNPGAVAIMLDDRQVMAVSDLDQRIVAERGRVRLAFAPTSATSLRLRLPWLAVMADAAKTRRREPWLGEVEIDAGSGEAPAAVSGTVEVTVHDALSGAELVLPAQPLTVAGGTRGTVSLPFTLAPAHDDAVRFLRVSAIFDRQGGNPQRLVAEAPLMVIEPRHPLLALATLSPADAAHLGFIVTNGFRNLFATATGTRERIDGWGQPDDLVFAYSRQLKQLGANAHTQANRLYVSESDLRHYSTPWRSFPNGEMVYDLGAPGVLERMRHERNWPTSEVVSLDHSDRWDSGPQMSALHGWQDLVEFDQHLRADGKPGLRGRTREQLAAEIHSAHEAEWQAWQLDRYLHALRLLRETFAKAGKKLVLRAQGMPLVPAAYEEELSKTIRGMSDDETWGMSEGSLSLTTGRQLALLAFNPSFALSTLLQWGYDMPMSNPIWHAPVSTTEPTRRHYYDRAWRAIIDRSGVYRSMHTYGYNTNAGISFTMTANDWQEFWRVEERHSLLAPEGPLGVGLVVSTARRSDPAHFSFSGGGEISEALDEIPLVSSAFRRFQEAGLSIPFSTNAGTLALWQGSAPLMLLNLCDFSDAEIGAVRALLTRGVRVVAFQGDRPLSASAGALFGVHPDGSADGATTLGDGAGHTLLGHHGALLITGSAAHLTPQQARALLALLDGPLQVPLHFPAGTCGYGFTMGAQRFVVVEDWYEEGRVVEVRLRASPAARSAQACAVNEHRALALRREGDDWVIAVPLRPADAALCCVVELP